LQAKLLNSDNKPCNTDRNELVFTAREADTGASDSGYLDPNAEEGEESAIKLKK
jgi:hypothetical protein